MTHKIKKIFIIFVFLFLNGYMGYSLYLKYTHSYNLRRIPQRIFLKTTNFPSPFDRQQDNSYCSLNEVCGFISNSNDLGFDFTYKETLFTPFLATDKNDTFKDKISYIERKPLPLRLSKISFQYQTDEAVLYITCTNKGVCYNNNKKLSFKLIAGADLINRNVSFNDNYELKEPSYLLLKKDNGDFFTLKRQKNNIYQILTPPRTHLKPHKFLLLLSSYKRPVFLMNQVQQLFAQSHGDYFDVSISLKGVNESIINQIILPNIQEFIDKKRLIFNTHVNKHQFTNLLNTYRDIDISKYDYLCKIDDDDFYHKDYLKITSQILNMLNNPEFIVSNNLFLLFEKKNVAQLKENKYARNLGSTICFNPNFAKLLLDVEKMDDAQITPLVPPVNDLKQPYFQNFEDHLINALAHNRGEKAIYFTFDPLFIYNRRNPSITRFK